jgi:hypothetical protein
MWPTPARSPWPPSTTGGAPGRLEDQTVVLRLLSDRRDDLVAERTRTLSRLHVLLADLHPGGATGS